MGGITELGGWWRRGSDFRGVDTLKRGVSEGSWQGSCWEVGGKGIRGLVGGKGEVPILDMHKPHLDGSGASCPLQHLFTWGLGPGQRGGFLVGALGQRISAWPLGAWILCSLSQPCLCSMPTG